VKDASPEQPAVVVSGDRDMLALVRDGAVRVLFPKRGTKEMTEFDEAAVERAYGVPPRLYPAFATLRGDPSDGLPGISGIGPKRAAALLQEHGSIDEVVAHAHALPPKQRAAFGDSADYLEAMKTVVKLVDDADILIRGGGALDAERLEELSVTHNLGSSGARLAQALRSER
ncbi:MAG: flap endonuclease, partial [Actinobacteria bacterium]|nr:flap endonuclease [Actinomycetota bacterium]